MGFCRAIGVPTYPNLRAIASISPDIYPVTQEINGGSLPAGRLYLSRFWNPVARGVSGFGIWPNGAGSKDLGVYVGNATNGFTKVGSSGPTGALVAQSTNRRAASPAFTCPAGICWFAMGLIGATTDGTYQQIDGTTGPAYQFTAGSYLYVDGQMGGGTLPATIAGGIAVDLATLSGASRVRHPGPVGYNLDLEFS